MPADATQNGPGPDRAAAGCARYRVVGFLDGQFGLAVAARNTLQALTTSGRTVDRVPVDERGGAERAAPAPAPGGINLFHLNPFEIARTSRTWMPVVDPGAANVCVPFWELPLLPRAWLPMLRAMDVVLAPTRFIEEACVRELGRGRVLHYPQAPFVPDGIAPDRARWGLRERATVFAVAFDPGSDVARKNPWAGIDAFARAFPGDEDVQLVVKARPWPGVRALEAEMGALRRRAVADPRIHVIEEGLPYEELLRLYACADVFVSLHRSEGLGLHLMEAMALGKVVVATGWSGNCDFMTSATSVPVPFALAPIAPRHWVYRAEVGRAGQVWAEPHVDAAASWLAKLHATPALRDALGRAAEADIRARRAAVERGATFDLLEAHLAGGARRDGAALAAAVRTTRRAALLARAREGWRRVQGRLLQR
jgi:glycosyltransferase involved in cell wall biosynthesis